ncbi:hypothetical protein OAC22_00800 [bacterium]|nr:hypothetical protein [bacterium]
MTNTDLETPESTDLDSFKGAPPKKKLDDKAAMLEAELASTKSNQASERTICIFIISVLVCALVGSIADKSSVFWFMVVSCIVLNVVVSRSFGAPLLATYLEPWNTRLQKAFDKHVLKLNDDEYED